MSSARLPVRLRAQNIDAVPVAADHQLAPSLHLENGALYVFHASTKPGAKKKAARPRTAGMREGEGEKNLRPEGA